MKKKYLFYVILLVITFYNSVGSEFGKITGVIYDAQTNQPIENVNVYIAKSTIGASTNSNGEFIIAAVPPGRYSLVLSHLSYQNQNISVDIRENQNVELKLKLVPTPIEFPEIDITDKYDDDWWNNFETFSEGFLGTTWFADGCEILNPFTLEFTETDDGILHATAREPILVENKSLGYKVKYLLTYFEYNFDTTKYSGFPYFTPMESDFAEDSLVWEENRLEAYMGSLRHFLRTLASSYELTKEKKDSVTIEIDFNDKTEEGYSFKYDDSIYFVEHGFEPYLMQVSIGPMGKKYAARPFYPDSIVARGKRENELLFSEPGIIQVKYFKEYSELTYDPQLSWIKILSYQVFFDKRGRYHDEFKLKTFGYMGKEGLAETLPFDYEPSDSLIFNTDFR